MNHEVESPLEHSWREVRQKVNPRAMTRHGRRRLGWSVARACTLVLLFGGLAALGVLWMIGGSFDSPAGRIAPVVKAEPLREIVVLTDGVLTEAWVTEQLALPPDIALMAVDLEAARQRLESAGQIRHAVVARDFPGTLAVTLEERTPVVRVMVPLDPKKPEPLLVARDGVVYRGTNYDPGMLERLPWLDGVRLTRSGDDVLPVEGMDRVSELLLAGQQEAPHLARTWQIVSLAEAPRLIVRTADVREIVFEPANFRRQFARLDYLLDLYREQGVPRDGIARLDVSIPSQVVVSFAAGSAPRRDRP
jgi:cell division protein FtsQ